MQVLYLLCIWRAEEYGVDSLSVVYDDGYGGGVRNGWGDDEGALVA